MKRIMIIFVAVLSLSVMASAQPKSAGIMLGGYNTFTYQHQAGSSDFFEANAGVFNTRNLSLSLAYNFMIVNPQWTYRGEWGFYAGPGLTLGSGFRKDNVLTFGLMGQVGMEYIFWFPLQLSVDLRPQFGFLFGKGGGFYEEGLACGLLPSLSARYVF